MNIPKGKSKSEISFSHHIEQIQPDRTVSDRFRSDHCVVSFSGQNDCQVFMMTTRWKLYYGEVPCYLNWMKFQPLKVIRKVAASRWTKCSCRKNMPMLLEERRGSVLNNFRCWDGTVVYSIMNKLGFYKISGFVNFILYPLLRERTNL